MAYHMAAATVTLNDLKVIHPL